MKNKLLEKLDNILAETKDKALDKLDKASEGFIEKSLDKAEKVIAKVPDTLLESIDKWF